MFSPFQVIKVINEQAYQLKLPKSMQVHPVFHVSLLKPYCVNTLADWVEPPPPPIGIVTDQIDEREWEVEEILKSRKRRGALQYLVKWKGYSGPDSQTWQSADKVSNAQDLVNSFHHSYPLLPSPAET